MKITMCKTWNVKLKWTKTFTMETTVSANMPYRYNFCCHNYCHKSCYYTHNNMKSNFQPAKDNFPMRCKCESQNLYICHHIVSIKCCWKTERLLPHF